MAGKKGVTFEAGDLLQSTFTTPRGCSGAHPFTLEIEVYKPEIGPVQTMAALAPLPGDQAALFNYGNETFGAAQFGGRDRSLQYKREAPAPESWHKITYTYDGREVRTYVDGKLTISKEVSVATATGNKITLGAAYNSEQKSYQNWFKGSIATLRVYDTAKSYMQVRNSLGYYDVFGYQPASGETVRKLTTSLSWSRGTPAAASFRVYLGTDSNAVANAGPESSLLLAELPAEKQSTETLAVTLGESYYWKVDQLNTAGKVQWPGGVKMFQVEKGRATEPEPRSRISGVPISTATLQWQPGKYATQQSVYFGESPETMTRCAAGLAAAARTSKLPGKLEYGRTYYWRVDSHNGDLPPTTGKVWRFRTDDKPIQNDVTIFVGSDPHYTANEDTAEGIRRCIDFMNELPGTPYPEKVGGGIVKTPRAFVMCGDIVDHGGGEGAGQSWSYFTNDFGLHGEGRLCYPVYELLGNHDAGEGAIPDEEVKKRNTRRKDLTMISVNGLHYSWDWDHVHCIALSKYAGLEVDETRGFQQQWNKPQGSMSFLEKDLKENVADSGRPVIIFQHYGWDGFSAGWGWWGEKDRLAMYDAIKDYNVIALVHGHTHGAYFQKWAGKDFHKPEQKEPQEGLDIISDASVQRGPHKAGEWFVFHITSNTFTAIHRFPDKWGISLQKPISMGTQE